VCRKCSLLATHRRLVAEVERFTESETEHDISSSKKKRIRETRKYEAQVKAALSEDRIEDELKGVKMERVISKMSTKQVMFARVRLRCVPILSSAHDNRFYRLPQY
jgi:ubiquitin carboxyl-terminal hydrolase 1